MKKYHKYLTPFILNAFIALNCLTLGMEMPQETVTDLVENKSEQPNIFKGVINLLDVDMELWLTDSDKIIIRPHMAKFLHCQSFRLKENGQEYGPKYKDDMVVIIGCLQNNVPCIGFIEIPYQSKLPILDRDDKEKILRGVINFTAWEGNVVSILSEEIKDFNIRPRSVVFCDVPVNKVYLNLRNRKQRIRPELAENCKDFFILINEKQEESLFEVIKVQD